jgi:hypothetical protein
MPEIVQPKEKNVILEKKLAILQRYADRPLNTNLTNTGIESTTFLNNRALALMIVDPDYIFTLKNNSNSKTQPPKCQVWVKEHLIDVIIDSGASVNIIDVSTYKQLNIYPSETFIHKRSFECEGKSMIFTLF